MTVTATSSCGSTSSSFYIERASTGDPNFPVPIEMMQASSARNEKPFSIYPNPSNGQLTLECAVDEQATIQLVSLNGKVHEERNVGLGKNQLDFSKYPAGIYLLKIISPGKKHHVEKIILNKDRPMQKLLFLVLIVLLCAACKKEDAAEPLAQLHFIEFVGEDGKNVFSSQKLGTEDVYYVSGESNVSWENLIAGKKQIAEQVLASTPKLYAHADKLASMLESDYILLEESQGYLERKRDISISGEKSVWIFSSRNRFSRDGQAAQVDTEVIDEHHVYLHRIVLKGI